MQCPSGQTGCRPCNACRATGASPVPLLSKGLNGFTVSRKPPTACTTGTARSEGNGRGRAKQQAHVEPDSGGRGMSAPCWACRPSNANHCGASTSSARLVGTPGGEDNHPQCNEGRRYSSLAPHLRQEVGGWQSHTDDSQPLPPPPPSPPQQRKEKDGPPHRCRRPWRTAG